VICVYLSSITCPSRLHAAFPLVLKQAKTSHVFYEIEKVLSSDDKSVPLLISG
jgi:hypothetical protein